MFSAALVAAPMRRRLVFALLLLGLALRSYHYLRDRAVWQDEAGLLLTIAARDYHDLFLGRLDYHQAAPPLYLCLLKTVSLCLGDSSYALRLPSFLASCAALLLFARVARRLLSSRALPWAVLLFAVSEQLLWHASEAKAYSVDVLAAVIVLAVPCWDRLGSLGHQLLVYLLLLPLLLLSSYPACFLCTGMLLAYLPAVIPPPRSASKSYPHLTLTQCWGRVGWGRCGQLYGVLVTTTTMILVWLIVGPVRSQHDADIHSCWVACMPRWTAPWTVPGWLLLSPLEVCRYCCKPLGQILILFAVPGTLLLWRMGQRTMVRLMLGPILLALIAACFHVYPFGGARVMVYAAPAILLLTAAGVPPVLRLLSPRHQQGEQGCVSALRHPRWRCGVVGRKIGYAGLIVLLLLPAASSLVQVVHPWSEADIPSAAAYVQRQRQDQDLILGNDVAQRYYFRDLGPAFHLLDESPFPAPDGARLWIVMTAALPRSERVRLAARFVPLGWRKCRQCEFAFTTVLLFSR